MAHTTCLVCLISTVSGPCKKSKICLGKCGASSGHIIKLKQSIFCRYLWTYLSTNIELTEISTEGVNRTKFSTNIYYIILTFLVFKNTFTYKSLVVIWLHWPFKMWYLFCITLSNQGQSLKNNMFHFHCSCNCLAC